MAQIDKLPNEILIHILEPFTTAQLMPLSRTSRRFRGIITDLVNPRIRRISSMPNYLVIESYPERARLSTPSMAGKFLRTFYDDGGQREGQQHPAGMANVSQWYSVFEPYEPDVFWRTPPPASDVIIDEEEESVELITRALLEDVRRHLVLMVGEGVVRVSRKWLAEKVAPVREPVRPEGPCESLRDYGGMLWVDDKRDMGVQFGVRPSRTERMLILIGVDDRPAVTYTLEYKAFVVRSGMLLRAIEESTAERVVEQSANALVAVDPVA